MFCSVTHSSTHARSAQGDAKSAMISAWCQNNAASKKKLAAFRKMAKVVGVWISQVCLGAFSLELNVFAQDDKVQLSRCVTRWRAEVDPIC